MKKVGLSLLLISLIFLCSCRGNCGKKQLVNTQQQSEKFELLKDFEYVHLIPDSLRTPEQKQLILLLYSVLVDSMVIENNHFVFKLNKTEFLKKGIPEPYYSLIMNDIKQNNIFIDSNVVEDMDQLLQDAFKKFEINSEEQNERN